MIAEELLIRILAAAGAAAFTGMIMLLQWQRRVASRVVALETYVGTDGEGGLAQVRADQAGLNQALQDHRLCVAETYVRREDYVQQTSLILSKLDAQAALLARLDERSKRWEVAHEQH